MARGGINPDNDFMVLSRRLQRRLPGIANRSADKTAAWLQDVAKQTTSFMDRTGSLRSSIKAGVTERAKAGSLKVEIALSAGYDDISYQDEDGRTVRTSDYAAAVEAGGVNPQSRTGRNAPRPYIGPTHQLAVSLDVMPKNFESEFRKTVR